MIHVDSTHFPTIAYVLRREMLSALPVKTERWQGVPVNTDTRELRSVCFEVNLYGVEDLDHWRQDVEPNLPWADDHFLERIGGEPLNPGVQWANWPWGQSANKFRTFEKFNHTYMQRLWPKFAGRTPDGKLSVSTQGHGPRKYPDGDKRPKFGIGHHYGDLQDLVELLSREPHTRQAVIPLFHPEDTGFGDGGRKMCSLLYQVMVRENEAHMYYPLRSCDLRRHFRDDVYLAIRMLLWILGECRKRSEYWLKIVPGSLSMHMTSLHVFESDFADLQSDKWM